MPELPTTQRAYTLLLRAATAGDDSWRANLWKTHEAVNHGAQIFGDWLLTLRGGLSHELANEREVESVTDTIVDDELQKQVNAAVEKHKTQPTRDVVQKQLTTKWKQDVETRRQRISDRRIVLALSWLSVESGEGKPTDERSVVASGEDDTKERATNVTNAFRQIMAGRKPIDVSPEDWQKVVDEWTDTCQPSLSAKIREDAVWVNRSLIFDELIVGQSNADARTDAQTLLWHLFGKDFLMLSRKASEDKKTKTQITGESSETGSDKDDAQQREVSRSIAIQSGTGAGRKTRHPFSHLFPFRGESKPFAGKRLQLQPFWREHLQPRIASNISLAKPKRKEDKEITTGRSPTELHREMFSKAASRLAQIHTKQKQQEVERDNRQKSEAKLHDLRSDSDYMEAIAILDKYCVQ